VSDNYDVAVVGGGPGGYVAAIRAAQLGKKTICVERAELGGICLNWGCIPTKALIKTAEVMDEIQHAEKYGLKVGSLSWDFAKIIGRSRDVSSRLNKGIHGLFKKYKVEHVSGSATLTSATSIDVATSNGGGVKKIQAKHIVLATGARSKFLPELKPDGKVVITSREALVLQQPPKHLLVVGAGPIGIEFAYFYSAFGCKVSVVEFQDAILPNNDREMGALLAKSLAKRGIEFFTGAKLANIKTSDASITASIVGAKDGREIKAVEADVCLSAVGMTGNIEDIGLEKLGIKTERGFIKVDDHCRTSVATVYAIGDVTGPPLLAHTASFQGHGVAETLAGKHHEPMNKDQVPGCTYCHPQLASVGLTEEQCKERKLDYKVGRFPFAASGMAIAAGDDEGMVKLLFGKKHGELLGAHILGGHASDLIAELGLALRIECTYEEILATIHAHPTLSEAVAEASGQAFGLAVHV
jgi:dihydrolipoamide dehydrogenase